jgi:LPS-assembly lipoprotein
MKTRRDFLAVGLLGLAGCSYRPLYGGSSGVEGTLAGIAVDEQKTRAGQLLRNELLSVISPPGVRDATRYRLLLDVSERETSVSALPNEPVIRRRVIVACRYQLTELSTGKTTTKGASQSAVGFDTVREPIADLQARKAALERAAIDVAQDIRMRLSAYFARNEA